MNQHLQSMFVTVGRFAPAIALLLLVILLSSCGGTYRRHDRRYDRRDARDYRQDQRWDRMQGYY